MKTRIILTVVITILIVSTIYGQSIDQLSQIPIPQDPEILSGELNNGLKYIIKKNDQPADRAELRLIVNIGAIDEDDDQLGLAHFTEHMVFKGTKSYTKQEMINYLNSIGLGFGGGLNAFTSMQHTVYTLSAPTLNTEQLEKAFHILSELAFHAKFDHDELEEERGVIIEEWRMYQGASQRIRDRIVSFILEGSRFAERTPIGTYEIIANFDRDTILRFYEDWYRPDLMTVLVIGDIEPEKIEEFIHVYFASEELHPDRREREKFQIPAHPEPRAIVAIDDEMSYTSVSATWRHEAFDFNNMEDYLNRTIVGLAMEMLNTRLSELTHNPQTPFSYAGGHHSNLFKAKSQFSVTAYTPEEKVLDSLISILTEVERIKRFGFNQGEFQRAKTRRLTRLEREKADMHNDPSSRLTWTFLRRIMNDQPLLSPSIDLQLFEALTQFISIEDVNSAFNSLITEENFIVTVIGPEKEGLVYPSEEELVHTRIIVKNTDLEDTADDTIETEIMTQIPTAGSIINEEYYSEPGIKIWELSNGARVLTKKTDFKNDEILFKAVGKGGYSLYPPEDAITAQNAASIAIQSGFGEFDKVTLDRILSGTLISIDSFIHMETQGFSGSFSPREKELFFQVFHQYVVNPRTCEESMASYIQRQITFIENSMLDPQSVFMDSVRVVINNNNPYTKPVRSDDLREISLEKVMEIYQDRFADFSDFTFFIVGNFDEEELMEYCKTYLASLPSLNRNETFRKVRSDPPEGQLKKVINIGRDEQSMVYAYSFGRAEYSFEEEIRINALQTLLQELLRVNVREKISGVYAIHIGASISKIPRETYGVAAVLYCDPKRYEEVIGAVYSSLDSLVEGEITEDDLNYVKSTMTRNLESRRIRNQYHLNSIESDYMNGLPVGNYKNTQRIIENINKEILLETARKYLTHNENLLKFVRLPRVQ